MVESREAFSPVTMLMDLPNPKPCFAHKVRLPLLVIHRCPLNRVRYITTLSYTNYCMERGGHSRHCTTKGIRREKIMQQNPVVINRVPSSGIIAGTG